MRSNKNNDEMDEFDNNFYNYENFLVEWKNYSMIKKYKIQILKYSFFIIYFFIINFFIIYFFIIIYN